jgi:hypothetical protein
MEEDVELRASSRALPWDSSDILRNGGFLAHRSLHPQSSE